MLVDQATGTQSGPLQIRKVDKSRVAPDDGGPVSQMQKIALLRVNPDGSHQYLSAAGPLPGTTVAVPPAPGLPNNGGAHQLLYQTARVREEVKDGSRIVIDEVDDYLCWTIVGICTCQSSFPFKDVPFIVQFSPSEIPIHVLRRLRPTYQRA